MGLALLFGALPGRFGGDYPSEASSHPREQPGVGSAHPLHPDGAVPLHPLPKGFPSSAQRHQSIPNLWGLSAGSPQTCPIPTGTHPACTPASPHAQDVPGEPPTTHPPPSCWRPAPRRFLSPAIIIHEPGSVWGGHPKSASPQFWRSPHGVGAGERGCRAPCPRLRRAGLPFVPLGVLGSSAALGFSLLFWKFKTFTGRPTRALPATERSIWLTPLLSLAAAPSCSSLSLIHI